MTWLGVRSIVPPAQVTMASRGLNMALARARQRKRARPEERAKENAKRDYRKEYDRDNSSAKRLAYRGNLQKIARKRGFYGNTPKGMELGHQADGSIQLEDKKQNRRKGARNASKARVRNTLARAEGRPRKKYRSV